MNDFIKRIQQLNEDLNIRQAHPSDASGFTSLMNKYYPRKDKIGYFSWRFFSCPTPSILYVVTTKKNDVIVGAFGLNVFYLSNGKKCGFCVDLVIGTEFTKRGLFFLLENKIASFAKKNNCSYLLGLSNTNGMRAYSQIDGWLMFGQISLLNFQPQNINSQKNDYSSNHSPKKQVYFEYNKALFNWRLNKNPEYKYIKIKSGKCISYVKIYYDHAKNITFGDIVYYPSSPTSSSNFSAVIDKSIIALQGLKAQKILTWCNEKSPLYKIFLSKGFIAKNQARYLCIKPLKPNENPNLLNWQILPADSEVF